MECYRDMTFCSFWMDCKTGENCVRALTKEITERAEFFGLPTCQFVDHPECFSKRIPAEAG